VVLGGRAVYLWRVQRIAAQTERLKLMVTERTRDLENANQELRKIPNRILEAQESERRRVARELHDSVKQILTQAHFRLGVASQHLHAGSAKWSDSLKSAQQMLQSAVRELTRISWNLRPSELDDLSFVDALSRTIREFHESTGINVETSIHDLPPLPKATEVNLYRIIQESLANIRKHSHAASVSITFKLSESALTMEICDDGDGFDLGARMRNGSGMGLLNMKERASAISGSLSILTAPGEGVRISLLIPLGALFQRSLVSV
jgi:signal transduction histidine kinase